MTLLQLLVHVCLSLVLLSCSRTPRSGWLFTSHCYLLLVGRDLLRTGLSDCLPCLVWEATKMPLQVAHNTPWPGKQVDNSAPAEAASARQAAHESPGQRLKDR